MRCRRHTSWSLFLLLVVAFISLDFGKFVVESDSNSVVDDVAKLLRDFPALAGASFDKIETLKALAAGTNLQYLNLLEPIGAALSTTLTIAVKQDSPEFKAIKALETGITRQFEQTQQAIEGITGKLSEFIVLDNYSNEVRVRLTNLKMYFNITLDQLIEREDRMAELLQGCNEKTSKPLLAINWLKEHADKNCNLPTREETLRFVQISSIFDQIEQTPQWSTFELDKYEKKKQDIILHAMRMTDHGAKSMAERLQKAIGKERRDVIRMLDDENSITQTCLLDLVHVANTFEREPLYNLADLIRLDLLELELFSIMCIQVQHPNKTRLIERKTKYVKDTVDSIFEKMGDWIEKKLHLSWDEPLNLRMKKAVGLQDLEISSYNATAEKLRNVANKLGPEKYQHLVILMPAWEQPAYWRVERPGARCTIITNFRNVNIFITRHEVEAVQQLSNAHKWLTNQRRTIEIILSQIWNWDSMEATAIELDKELNGLSQSDGYVTVILMKNKKWLAEDCTIDFGISVNTFVGGKFPSENVTFFIDPLMEDAVHIQIFFVL